MDKMLLCRDLNLSFADIRDHVMEDVFSRGLDVCTLGTVHTCEEELLSDMLDWQRLSGRRNLHFSRTSPQPTKQNSSTKLDKTETPAEENTTPLPQFQYSKIRTFSNSGPVFQF